MSAERHGAGASEEKEDSNQKELH